MLLVKKPTLAGGPPGTERRHAIKGNLLSERRRSEFQIFPRAGVQFRPSGVRLDLLVLLDQAKRTPTWGHATTLESKEHKPWKHELTLQN